MENPILILGTASPRRIELFKQFSLEFKCVTSGFDEDSVSTSLSPKEYVKEIARGKAELLAKTHPQNPILTADTTVHFENNHYGKPQDRSEAFETLQKFRGNKHEVWTGLCLYFQGEFFHEEDMTTVFFSDVSDEALNNYIDRFKPLDKAGSYAIQDAAGLMVDQIHGNYHNVVGFPLPKVALLLKKAEIDLWKFLNKPSYS